MGGDVTSEEAVRTPAVESGWTPLELLIWRFKGVIAAGILACLIVAGLVTLSAPPVYRARAVIDTGDLRDEGKDVARLAARVLAELKPRGVIELAATAPTPEAAAARVMEPIRALLPRLERLMEIQTEKAASTRRLADEVRANVDGLRAMVNAVGPRTKTAVEAAAFATLLTHVIANETRLIDLDTQVRLQEARQARPRLVGPASVEKVSIRRRLAVNLAIGSVVGLAASLAFAVVLQHLRSGGRGSRAMAARG